MARNLRMIYLPHSPTLAWHHLFLLSISRIGLNVRTVRNVQIAIVVRVFMLAFAIRPMHNTSRSGMKSTWHANPEFFETQSGRLD